MPLKTLTASDIEQFRDLGYVAVRGAFSKELAARGRQFIWGQLGLDADDPSTWTKDFIHIQNSFADDPFPHCFTSRLIGAYDDLLGEGKHTPPTKCGWWPVSFPGFETGAWKPPTKGWHVDGNFFQHHVDSKEQGLLQIVLFSDIEKGGGGTALEARSHIPVARFLRDSEPEGVNEKEIMDWVKMSERGEVVEATGEAGDVFLMHPFMIHARSPNTGGSPRFICNPCVRKKEKMNLNPGPGENVSVVERMIIEALAG